MGEMKEIALKEIGLSGSNPRRHFDEKKLRELADSIKEKGVVQPIVVRRVNGKYELVCGERRFKASQKAGQLSIPAVIRGLTDMEVLEFQVIENLQREDLHPLEEAEGYEALLKKHGYKTADDIAAKIGKSRSYVYGRLKLCDLIPENRQLFYKDKFSPSVALLVARVPKDLQKEAGKIISRGGPHNYASDEPMSYRRAHEYIVDNYTLRLKDAPFDTKDAALGGKAGVCASCQKRTGNQKELFPDISSADVCTDPTCFNMKKNAFTQRTIAKAKASGKMVLSLDESKRQFRYESSTTPESKYINLDDNCWALDKSPKYRQLVKRVKDAPVVYAVQPYTGRLIEMIEKTELPKILKKIGLKLPSGSSDSGPDPKARKKAKTENRIREAKRAFWIDKVATAKDRRAMGAIMLDVLLDDLGTSAGNDLLPFKNNDSWCASWNIKKLYELGESKVNELIVKVISKKSEILNDESLEFLSTTLGFEAKKHFVITEDYLKAHTKDQLIKLGKEMGLTKYLEQKKICDKLGDKKKTELIDLFLKKGFKLEGRVPEEIKGRKGHGRKDRRKAE